MKARVRLRAIVNWCGDVQKKACFRWIASTAFNSTARLHAHLTGIGIFLFFGAVMASLAGITLLWRGTVLERMWTLNPAAYKHLVPFGAPAGIVFLLLGVALAIAGAGWFKRRLWGWRLAVAVIGTQDLGGLGQCPQGRCREGGL